MRNVIDLSRYFDTSAVIGSDGIAGQSEALHKEDLQNIVEAIAAASAEIAVLVSVGTFAPARPGSRLIDLAVQAGPVGRAYTILLDRLRGCGVRSVTGAGRGEATPLDAEGHYVVAVDALDGASNMDTNMPLGTIFSVSFAADAASEQTGAMQLAAGFIIYGPRTNLVLTFGQGVDIFTLDREAWTYQLADEAVRIPVVSSEYAIDASNYRHWPSAVRTMIDDHREGQAEPGAQAFNMRWIGSLVAEAYRILKRGGVFLCPSDARKSCETGCQRVLTAAHPIALIMEQAGGAATTGHKRVLDCATRCPDARTALIFGSRDTVEKIERLHALPESYADASPLFGQRGLFRI